MANRRMFSKTITNSSNFLMMSQSAQNLYFHLGMNADDDGFCEHFTVMRMTESKPDDLRSLVERGFVFIFDQKVLIIKDWKENNYIQADRYTPSKYIETYRKEILALSVGNSCIQDVYKADTQVRLGKVRLGNMETVKKTDSVSSLKEVSPTVISAEKFDRKWLEGFIERHDEKEAEEIAKQFKGLISITEVFLKAEEIPDYCERKNRWKKYSNFRTVLTSWLRKDYKAKVLELERVKEEMKQQGYATAEELFNL